MALIDELKEKREVWLCNVGLHDQRIVDECLNASRARDMIADLDRAIAALEPAPIPEPETQTGQGVEIPEGFTKWEGGEWTGNSRDIVQVIFHDEPTPYFPERADMLLPLWNWSECGPDFQRIIAYRIIEASAQEKVVPIASQPELAPVPGTGEESRDQFEEEAQRAAAIELTVDAPIEQDRAYEAYEPLEIDQPTEGYAPVTNPEADALAKAHEYYDPKAVADRNRFNPFGMFRREPEGA
jgi:hypothetical protein